MVCWAMYTFWSFKKDQGISGWTPGADAGPKNTAGLTDCIYQIKHFVNIW